MAVYRMSGQCQVLRVSDQTREQVLRIGREEFDGASADETVRRLIDEHWQARAVAAVVQYRHADAQDWAEYLAEAEELATPDAPITSSRTGFSRRDLTSTR